jgi:hypothetical protein
VSIDRTSHRCIAETLTARDPVDFEVLPIHKPQQVMLDDRLLKALGSRFAELGFLSLERMEVGAEATTVTKVIARGEFVLKAIDEARAEEEVRQISRIEQRAPGFFPRLVHAQIATPASTRSGP